MPERKGILQQKKLLFLLYAGCIVLLIVLPLNTSENLNAVTVLRFRGDYVIHALLFLPWAFFGKSFPVHAPLWLAWGLFFAAATEGLQYFLPYRTWNINDLAANAMGVILGSIICVVMQRIPYRCGKKKR